MAIKGIISEHFIIASRSIKLLCIFAKDHCKHLKLGAHQLLRNKSFIYFLVAVAANVLRDKVAARSFNGVPYVRAVKRVRYIEMTSVFVSHVRRSAATTQSKRAMYWSDARSS